jgi:hypothetical protein
MKTCVLDTAFEHECFDMAHAQGVRSIPADARANDRWGKMGTFEVRGHRRSPS